MTQNDKVEKILRERGQVDNFSCLNSKLTTRLSARIYDLKKRGWEFTVKETPDGNTVYISTKQPHIFQAQIVEKDGQRIAVIT